MSGAATEFGLDISVRPSDTDSGGDHDRMSHYVRKDEIVRSMVEGTPTVALCGKVWIPSRDPDKFPLCPTCEEIFKSLPTESD